MTTLSTIKTEAIERFKKVRTDAIGEMFDNADKDGIYPTTKFFGKIDAALLSEIDRAVDLVIEEVKDRLDSLEVDLVETSSFEYDKGWQDCNLTWDLRIEDYVQKLFTLKEKCLTPTLPRGGHDQTYATNPTNA